MNLLFTQIEGTGMFYNNKRDVVVATFKDGNPDQWAKTYHFDGSESYSFFKNG